MEENVIGEVDLPDDKSIVGIVGRICKQKASDVLLRWRKR